MRVGRSSMDGRPHRPRLREMPIAIPSPDRMRPRGRDGGDAGCTRTFAPAGVAALGSALASKGAGIRVGEDCSRSAADRWDRLASVPSARACWPSNQDSPDRDSPDGRPRRPLRWEAFGSSKEARAVSASLA